MALLAHLHAQRVSCSMRVRDHGRVVIVGSSARRSAMRFIASMTTFVVLACCTPRPSVHVDPPTEPPTPSVANAHDAHTAPATPEDSGSHETMRTAGPGFPNAGPWVSFYGNAKQLGDVGKLARTF